MATSTKAAALDANVAAGAAVAAIKDAAVTMDVADTDTADKAMGAKVHTIKGTKSPTTKVTRALVTKSPGAGPTKAGPTTRRTLFRYLQPESQNAQSFHNVPVPGTVMVPVQIICGAQAPGGVTNRAVEMYLMARAL